MRKLLVILGIVGAAMLSTPAWADETPSPSPTPSVSAQPTPIATTCEEAAAQAGFDDPEGYCADPEPADDPSATPPTDSPVVVDDGSAPTSDTIDTEEDVAPVEVVDDPMLTDGDWQAVVE